MKIFTADQFNRFLQAIDNFLDEEADLILIGGTAAALFYKASRATKDMDTYNSISKKLRCAHEKAKAMTGLNIPLEQSSVVTSPQDFEDRLQVYKPEMFKHLIVKHPEIIDLILMKTGRCSSGDLEVIEDLVRKNKVKLNEIVDRFTREMKTTVGDLSNLRLNFLAVIERCFGESSAQKLDGQLVQAGFVSQGM
ncbi:MAG: hypothetical protein C5B49_16465 [Bdellovibrio sp.]|nr:MAG: hypothetical protein C5B49_16465 [Bdellovibrio sp.]